MLKCYHQSWLGSGHATFFSFATTTTRQGVRASVTSKFKAVVSKCSSRNEYNHNTVSNNFLAGKHGHVVAAVLSHAQLWFLRCTYLWHSRYRLQRNPCKWKKNFPHVFKYYVTKFYSYHLTTTVLWCTFPWFLWYCFSLIFVVLFFSFIFVLLFFPWILWYWFSLIFVVLFFSFFSVIIFSLNFVVLLFLHICGIIFFLYFCGKLTAGEFFEQGHFSLGT